MSNISQLLKNHIDTMWAKHEGSYKDIAKALQLNVSSVRSGVYNDSLGFDKFCKVAVVAGFPLMKYAGWLAERYPRDVKDLEDAKKRIKTYEESLKSLVLVAYNPEEYKEAFDDALKDSNKDTAQLVMVAKMRDSVCKDVLKGSEENVLKQTAHLQGSLPEGSEKHIEIKKLVQNVEDEHNKKEEAKEGEAKMSKTNNQIAKTEEKMPKTEIECTKAATETETVADPAEEKIAQKISEVVKKPVYAHMDVVRPLIENMKGLEAVGFYNAFTSLWKYAAGGDVADLRTCYNNIAVLLAEKESK